MSKRRIVVVQSLICSILYAGSDGNPEEPVGSATDGGNRARSSATRALDPNQAWGTLLFPALARKMLQWPSEAVLNGPVRVKDIPRDSRACIESARCIRTMIRGEWLPPTARELQDRLVFLRDWQGRLDIVFARWEMRGYTIHIAQTPTLVAIKIVPPEGSIRANGFEGRKTYALQTALSLLRDTTTVAKPESESVKGIHDGVRAWSFANATIKEIDGSAVDLKWRIALAGPWPTKPDPERKGGWRLNTSKSHVRLPGPVRWCSFGWYTDGNEFGLWTMKHTPSWATLPFSYGELSGDSWF